MRKTSVAVFEVPARVKGKAMATYFMQFGQILGFSSEHKVGEWRFDVMVHVLTILIVTFVENPQEILFLTSVTIFVIM